MNTKSILIFAIAIIPSLSCNSVSNKSVSTRSRSTESKEVGPESNAKAGATSTPTREVDSLSPPENLVLLKMPQVEIAYDFRGTISRPSVNAAVVRMVVQNGVLRGRRTLRLTANLRNLRSSKNVVALKQDVLVNADGVIDFAIRNLNSDTVYRIEDVVLTDMIDTSLSKKIKDPYFVATSGISPLAQARRELVLKALAEGYDWDNSFYDRSKLYANRSGWCDAFYVWAVNGIFKIDSNDYAPSWFNSHGALGSASILAELANRESIIGDMIRYDGLFLGHHTFMILSYDPDSQKVWTVEGNFNNRVERYQRSLNSGWKLGHLNDTLIQQPYDRSSSFVFSDLAQNAFTW